MSFQPILESKNIPLLPMWYFAEYQIEHVNKILAVFPAVVLCHAL